MKWTEFKANVGKGMCYGSTGMLKALFGAEAMSTALVDQSVAIKYGFCDENFALSEWHGNAHRCVLNTTNAACKTDEVLVSIQLSGQGGLILKGAGNGLVLQAGEFCIYQSDQQVTYTTPGEFRRICLRIPAASMAAYCPLWHANLWIPYALKNAGGELFVSMLHALQQYGESAQQGCRDQVLRFLLQMLSNALVSDDQQVVKMPAGEKARQSKRAIVDYVAENLADPGLSVERVAGAVGLSQRYVNRLFASDELHLMQWVWKERLTHCYRELQASGRGRSITSIAYAWGFSDSAHFSRAFRRCFGVSPSQVRDRDRGLVLS